MLLTTLAMLTSVVTFPSAYGPVIENFRQYNESDNINGVIQYVVTIDRPDLRPSVQEPLELISAGLNGCSLMVYSTSTNSSSSDSYWTLHASIEAPSTYESYNIAGYVTYDDGDDENLWYRGGFYFDFLTYNRSEIYNMEFDHRFQELGDELDFTITLFLISEETYNISNSDVNGYYQNGYDAGYTAGESDGFALGDQQGYNEGYQTGYSVGYNDADNQDATALTIFTGIINVGLLPVNFFLSILNFEVFGINIGAVVSATLTIAIVVIIIRIITGKKND